MTAAALLLFLNGLSIRNALDQERAGKIEERQKLSQDAQRLRDQLARREAEVTQLQAQLAEGERLRTAGVSALPRQREEAKAALAQLRREFAEQQSRAAEEASVLGARLSQWEIDVARLQTQLQEQEREVAETVNTLRDRLQRETAELASLRSEVVRQEALIRLIEDPQSRLVRLRGLDPAPRGLGKNCLASRGADRGVLRLPPPSSALRQDISTLDHLGPPDQRRDLRRGSPRKRLPTALQHPWPGKDIRCHDRAVWWQATAIRRDLPRRFPLSNHSSQALLRPWERVGALATLLTVQRLVRTSRFLKAASVK